MYNHFVFLSCIYAGIVVQQHPVDSSVCQDGSATFTCVIFISSGALVIPGWLRDGDSIDVMRHTITSNLTGDSAAPAYINGIITVSNVTVLDDGAMYQCGIGSIISNSATLHVVGKCTIFLHYFGGMLSLPKFIL